MNNHTEIFELSENDSFNFYSLPTGQSKSSNTSPEFYMDNDANKQLKETHGDKFKMLRKKSQSFEGLNSGYKNRRYSHVPSKVKEYIDEMKRINGQINYKRTSSLPVLQKMAAIDHNDEEADGDNEHTENKAILEQKLLEQHHLITMKDDKINELQRFYDTVSSSLSEANIKNVQLESKIDQMRLKLCQFEDSEKKINKRKSSIFETNNEILSVPTNHICNSAQQNPPITPIAKKASTRLPKRPFRFEFRNPGRQCNYNYKPLLNDYCSDNDEWLDSQAPPTPYTPNVLKIQNRSIVFNLEMLEMNERSQKRRKIKKIIKTILCCPSCVKRNDFDSAAEYGHQTGLTGRDPVNK